MNTLSNFLKLLNNQEKKKFLFLIIMITLVAFSEAISIGSIIPLIKIVVDSEYIITLREFLNIEILNNASDKEFILIILASVFTLFSAKYIFVIIFYYFLHKFTFSLKYRLQTITFRNYLNKELSFFFKNNTSYLLRNITSEIDQFSVAISSYLIIVSEILIILALALLTIFTQSPVIILSLLFLTVFSFFCFKMIKKSTSKLGYERQRNIGNQLKTINDAFGLIIDIILLKKQNLFLNKFKFFSKKTNSSLFKHNFFKSLPRIIFEWVFLIIIISMLIYLIQQKDFSNSIANITFLTAIMFKLIPSFNKVFVSLQDIKFSSPVIEELNSNLLSVEKPINKNDFILKKFRFEEQVFRNIDFSYNNENYIFENLNLKIQKNKFIGIHGKSGSGKTTFINLLLGLLKPSKGEIIVNDQNIYDSLNQFQNIISYVPQDIYLIDSDIKENVSLEESENLNNHKIENIKKALQEAEFFSNNEIIDEKFLSLKVGQKGINLSGGQLQRVGIARAFYRKSQILILDEATRSLDNSTENEIIETLLKKKDELTIIMISHKIENFKYCDTIIEIKDKSILIKENHKI